MSMNRPRHGLLYFDTLVYRVDDTLFKLPSRHLQVKVAGAGVASSFARLEGAGNSEGSSGGVPVCLSPLPYDGNAHDFANLAKVIIALTADLPMPTNYTLKQWLSVIKLSTFWGLTNIRAIGVQHLSNWALMTSLDQWLHLLEFCTNREQFSDIRSISVSHLSIDNPHFTLDQWTSALDLTFGRTEFSDVSNIAISHISSLRSQLSSIDKVKLGRKYNVREWVCEGLHGLAKQQSPPSLSALGSLGLQTALRLLHIRDLTLGSRSGCGQCRAVGVPVRCRNCQDGSWVDEQSNSSDLDSLIAEHFPDDLILQDFSV
ncbi:hypothetical protein E1B28_010260 [Marasmius oreades]|uniref:Uncharacterized protein n=1 Tax=Marasmius oreades TaxID=181124 RepID=A0A9P7RXD9_9AGAR|nr:uncharacterized protein E1B28_010260 [Marasmius oreades]KAG7091208.1 hypothetical protein E1B28_010260 [Marasmius oreades]